MVKHVMYKLCVQGITKYEYKWPSQKIQATAGIVQQRVSRYKQKWTY